MKLYSGLSKITFLKNRFVAKFLFVAFLGIHIPLVGLLFFVVYLENQFSPSNVFLIALVLTIIAALFTLLILNKLMSPVLLGSKALIDYRTNRKMPRLPLNYTDEAGVMLQNIQSTIQMNQKILLEKKEQFQFLTNDFRARTEKSNRLLSAILQETDQDTAKKLAVTALKSNDQQLKFVAAFTEIIKEETLVDIEQVKIKRLNMQSFFSELKRSSKEKLEAKNLDFNMNIHVSEVKIKVNTKLLERAFRYLIDNAIQHATDNSKIEVIAEKAQGKLMLSFRNYGIGFESIDSELIFTKFTALEENHNEYVPGTGLYLARKIIERFSGSMRAESSGVDKGATLTIELKLYR